MESLLKFGPNSQSLINFCFKHRDKKFPIISIVRSQECEGSMHDLRGGVPWGLKFGWAPFFMLQKLSQVYFSKELETFVVTGAQLKFY